MSKKIYNLNTIYISERLQALSAYSNAINYDAALAVIQKDAGILLASLSPEKIPALFKDHMLSTVSFLSHCRPMMEMIENQVFLSQKMYAKVTGRSETLLPVCEKMHYETIYQPDLFQVDDQR